MRDDVRLARAITGPNNQPLYMIDAVASGTNEVDGIELPALIPVTTGQRCQVLKQGDAPGVILGPAPRIEAGGVTSGSTDTNGDFSRTFAAAFASPPVVVVSPISIIGRDYAVMSVSETGFTVRMFDTATQAALPSLSARFSWIAIGT